MFKKRTIQASTPDRFVTVSKPRLETVTKRAVMGGLKRTRRRVLKLDGAGGRER